THAAPLSLHDALPICGELVVHDLPRGGSLVDRLEETGAAFLFGVPTHAFDLLAEMRARGLRHLGAVRGFRISGAAEMRKPRTARSEEHTSELQSHLNL